MKKAWFVFAAVISLNQSLAYADTNFRISDVESNLKGKLPVFQNTEIKKNKIITKKVKHQVSLGDLYSIGLNGVNRFKLLVGIDVESTALPTIQTRRVRFLQPLQWCVDAWESTNRWIEVFNTACVVEINSGMYPMDMWQNTQQANPLAPEFLFVQKSSKLVEQDFHDNEAMLAENSALSEAEFKCVNDQLRSLLSSLKNISTKKNLETLKYKNLILSIVDEKASINFDEEQGQMILKIALKDGVCTKHAFQEIEGAISALKISPMQDLKQLLND